MNDVTLENSTRVRRPMRLIIVCRAYHPDEFGGGEVSTRLIAEGLAKTGVDVHIITITDRLETIGKTETFNGVVIHRLGPGWPYWSIRSDRQSGWRKAIWHGMQSVRPFPRPDVQRLIRSIKPDLVHSSTIEDLGVSLWSWLRRNGIATVHTLRSYHLLHRNSSLYEPNRDRSGDGDLTRYPKRIFAASLDGVIGITDHILQRHHRQGFFADARTTIIGNPVGWEPLSADYVPASKIRLGYLGRISPEKGLEPLVDALNAVAKTDHWELAVAGRGPESYQRMLQERTKSFPISWLGYQDARTFLSSLDALLVPSRWEEPFGRIIIEAHSVGVPVACLNRGGMPELIAHGKNGWVVDEWSPSSIDTLLSECRNMDRNAIVRSSEPYTVDVVAAKHLHFYQQFCDSSVAPPAINFQTHLAGENVDAPVARSA